jgi:hypothetical protein
MRKIFRLLFFPWLKCRKCWNAVSYKMISFGQDGKVYVQMSWLVSHAPREPDRKKSIKWSIKSAVLVRPAPSSFVYAAWFPWLYGRSQQPQKMPLALRRSASLLGSNLMENRLLWWQTHLTSDAACGPSTARSQRNSHLLIWHPNITGTLLKQKK